MIDHPHCFELMVIKHMDAGAGNKGKPLTSGPGSKAEKEEGLRPHNTIKNTLPMT
jgi:hypothetical protein